MTRKKHQRHQLNERQVCNTQDYADGSKTESSDTHGLVLINTKKTIEEEGSRNPRTTTTLEQPSKDYYNLKTLTSLSRIPGVMLTYLSFMGFYETIKSYTPQSVKTSVHRLGTVVNDMKETYVMPQLTKMISDETSWLHSMDHYAADKLDSLQAYFSSLGYPSKKLQNYYLGMENILFHSWNSIVDRIGLEYTTKNVLERIFPELNELGNDTATSAEIREQVNVPYWKKRSLRLKRMASVIRQRLQRSFHSRLHQQLGMISRTNDLITRSQSVHDFLWFTRDQIVLQKHLLQGFLRQTMIKSSEKYHEMSQSLNKGRQDIMKATQLGLRHRIDELYATIQVLHGMFKTRFPNAHESAVKTWQNSLIRFLLRLNELQRELEKEIDFYESIRAKKLIMLIEESIIGLEYITSTALKYSGISDEATKPLLLKEETASPLGYAQVSI